MSDPRDQWGDARLNAAFAARAAAEPLTPTDLIAETLAAVPQAEGRRGWNRPLGALAGLAGMAVAIVVAAIVLLPGRIAPSPAGPSASPARSSADGESSQPSTSIGSVELPIRTVSQALAIRDSESAPIEMTVQGWIRDGVPIRCPVSVATPNPARLGECRQALPWIVEDRDQAGPGVVNVDPTGPAFQPSFAIVDGAPLTASAPGSASPVQLAIIGHFHDRRATLCGEACDQTFVVDRVEAVDGVRQPPTTVDALGVNAVAGNLIPAVNAVPIGPANRFDAVIAPPGSGLTVIARRRMSSEDLIKTEPELAPGWPALGTATVVTSITAIDTGNRDRPLARTFLAPDGSPTYYEVTAAGVHAAGDLQVPASPTDLLSRMGPPITVRQAIDHRDQHLDDTELLVRGQVWGPGPIFCTLTKPAMPVLDQCPSTLTWIADERPDTSSLAGTLPRPTGPAMNLVIPPESADLADVTEGPRERLILGHFDDHRASTCAPDDVERCRRNFVVDAILDPSDPHLVPLERQALRPAPANTPRGTADWAATAAGLPAQGRADRLISAIPVDVVALGALEPDAEGADAMSNVETVWLVHFLDTDATGAPVVRTRIVVDAPPVSGAATVYDVTKDGLIRAWLAAAP